MLKFGQGGAFPAHNGTEASTQAIFLHVFKGGLLQDQTKRALDALFNVNSTASTSAWPTTIPNFAALQQTLTTGLRQALLTRQQQVLFAVYWNNAPSVPVPAGKTPATFLRRTPVLATRQDGGGSSSRTRNMQVRRQCPACWAAATAPIPYVASKTLRERWNR